jgi:UDP-hydrolysing UDP-N-acetyl-D-glucosamine 2-epimerase
MRRLTYVTGTRADFGLMVPTLRTLAATADFQLELVVAGMHLSERFGFTASEVEESGLPIAARIPLPIEDDSSRGMALCAGEMAAAMARYLSERRPDMLLLLGDRSEMLASALPATVASIPIVHFCGGERSGTVDENMRHALSKLAHLHMAATPDAEQRLLAMGEEPWRVHLVGAPGLVGIQDLAQVPLAELAERYGFDAARPFAILLFHSVVQDADVAGDPVRLALQRLAERDLQVICLMPNADHGTGQIRAAIEAAADRMELRVVTHMPREDYVSAVAHSAMLVGNSSSGIIEAATFGTPVVNIGDRQQDRARSANVVDADPEYGSIERAMDVAAEWPRGRKDNIYGDGTAHLRVAKILSELDLDEPELLKKKMTY